MIGRTLSHYKILSEISRGGMGIVYRAVDLNLDREVALKVLPPELVADSERKRRFVQEAKAAAKLDHPHIGMIFEIDEADGTTFIAMELIEGEKLKDLSNKERLPLTRALELATEVAEGLARAHDKGIVHRDLKPANIMVTEDGHAKVIDFGLAKLVETLEEEGSDIETFTKGKTDPGKVMGTVSYMSPEQARGKKVDHRSDIFSLGIVLHEMLTGRPPFQSDSGIDTLHAILKGPTPRLPTFGPDVTDEAAYDLQHIVDKCLAKDRKERYQTVRDTVVDLRAARRHLESGSVPPVTKPVRSNTWVNAVAVTAVTLLVAVALWLYFGTSARDEASPTSTKPSMAVLHFENNTGDPSLDWLRTALTDMLVTDLSQSPHLEILSTDRLYQILEDMNRLDQRITSFNVVQEVAGRANINTVVLGSFVKAGDTIRISVRLQDATTGKILSTEWVEGTGESSIFPMVDDLTRRIKAGFQMPVEADAELDLDLKDVTTASLDAYRHYVEGVALWERSQPEEAIPLLEKAVELDPDFAMALAKLAVVHSSLGHDKEYEDYIRRALEHSDRLTLRERYYIEGYYYFQKEVDFDRAIEAFDRVLEQYDNHAPALTNLSVIYLVLERYDEAIELLEKLRRRGDTFPDTYAYLASCYRQRGDFQRGYEALLEISGRTPESAAVHRHLGNHLLRWGKLNEALESIQRAEELAPGHFLNQHARWRLHLLREEWNDAVAEVESLTDSRDPYHKWLGFSDKAITRLYQGRSKDAIRLLEEAVGAYAEPGLTRADSRSALADVLLQKGKAARALEQAQKAQEEGEGNWPEWQGFHCAALAEMKLGRAENAMRNAEELLHRTASIPSKKERRRHHLLLGELALARGDNKEAIDELELARSMLPGFGGARVLVWYALASAYLASENEDVAIEWFQRAAETGSEHTYWPIPYVRSFYFLGKIHENRGEMEKAREYYRRFYEYWKDGDMDRERVEEARKKLAS